MRVTAAVSEWYSLSRRSNRVYTPSKFERVSSRSASTLVSMDARFVSTDDSRESSEWIASIILNSSFINAANSSSVIPSRGSLGNRRGSNFLLCVEVTAPFAAPRESRTTSRCRSHRADGEIRSGELKDEPRQRDEVELIAQRRHAAPQPEIAEKSNAGYQPARAGSSRTSRLV